MMFDYQPDRWVMLKISHENNCVYKVLASWYGGYLGSDSWQLNSGVTSIKTDGDYYLFTGSSGSVYKCHRHQYGMSGYTTGIYKSLIDKITTADKSVSIELMDENFDFVSIDYLNDQLKEDKK